MFPMSFQLLFCKSYLCVYMYMPISANPIVINVCILTNRFECSNANILFTFRKLKVDIHFKCFAKHVFHLCLGFSSQKSLGLKEGSFEFKFINFFIIRLFYSNNGTTNTHFLNSHPSLIPSYIPLHAFIHFCFQELCL